MEFGPNETERLFDRLLRSLLRDRLPAEEIRRRGRLATGFDDALWTALAEIGLAGLLIPERQGGSGQGMFAAALAAEALGYFAAPVPFTGPAVMAALAAREAAGAGDAWLPRIAEGTVRFAIAFEEFAGAAGRGRAERRGDRVSGHLEGVFDLPGATHILLVLADGAVAALPVSARGVQAALLPSLDPTRPLGAVNLADAAVEFLEAPGQRQARALRILDAGRAMLAADTLGAAQRMLDQAVAYVGQREQFGRPVGSFQAVKHMCAEMAALLEPARALVWYAAHAQDAIPEEARLAACHAKAHLGEVGREVSRLATEAHGGIGFTDELGLHYWFRRISANRQLLGSPERCRREAAALQGWGAA